MLVASSRPPGRRRRPETSPPSLFSLIEATSNAAGAGEDGALCAVRLPAPAMTHSAKAITMSLRRRSPAGGWVARTHRSFTSLDHAARAELTYPQLALATHDAVLRAVSRLHVDRLVHRRHRAVRQGSKLQGRRLIRAASDALRRPALRR